MEGTASGAPRALVRVDRIALRGPGILLVRGESDEACRALFDALGDVLGIDPARRISMSGILRRTVARSRTEPAFARRLEEQLSLSGTTSVFDCIDTSEALTDEVRGVLPDLERYLGRAPSRFISEEVGGPAVVSQLDWLDYCVARGRIVPDRWAHALLAAEIEAALAGGAEGAADAPFLLEGHPRTVGAARSLLVWLESLKLPVLKVLCVHSDARTRSGRTGAFEGERRVTELLGTRLGAARVLEIDIDPGAEAGLEAAGFACDGAAPEPPAADVPRSPDGLLGGALRALGVPAVIVGDLLRERRESGEVPATSRARRAEPAES